jgi:hypothetical protein
MSGQPAATRCALSIGVLHEPTHLAESVAAGDATVHLSGRSKLVELALSFWRIRPVTIRTRRLLTPGFADTSWRSLKKTLDRVAVGIPTYSALDILQRQRTRGFRSTNNMRGIVDGFPAVLALMRHAGGERASRPTPFAWSAG